MIEIKALRSGYRGVEVLHGIDLRMESGRVYGIVGPNGCGKSTLLKTIAGLCPVLSGEVRLNGRSLEGLAPAETAKQVAYLPQGRSVPAITAGRLVLHGRFPYLSYPRRYRQKDFEIARNALKWAGAEEFAEKNLSQLSGGQRQRVYIAMTLAQETGAILMDEPTTYLDINSKFEVLHLAGRLARMGKTVVLVLHDLDLVLRYAHEVILLADGRVRAVGAPEEVCSGIGECFGVAIRQAADRGERHYLFSPAKEKDEKARRPEH